MVDNSKAHSGILDMDIRFTRWRQLLWYWWMQSNKGEISGFFKISSFFLWSHLTISLILITIISAHLLLGLPGSLLPIGLTFWNNCRSTFSNSGHMGIYTSWPGYRCCKLFSLFSRQFFEFFSPWASPLDFKEHFKKRMSKIAPSVHAWCRDQGK